MGAGTKAVPLAEASLGSSYMRGMHVRSSGPEASRRADFAEADLNNPNRFVSKV